MTPKKLLILDLDETLIFAAERPLARGGGLPRGAVHVYRRPGLADFLEHCFELFDVAVWTSSSPLYAEEVVGAVFPDPSRLAFVWASDRCTPAYDLETGEHCAQKNLKKIKGRGYPLGAVIAVDDSPEKWRQSYGNLVRVTPYHGTEEDTELSLLASYLHFLRKAAGYPRRREEAVAASCVGCPPDPRQKSPRRVLLHHHKPPFSSASSASITMRTLWFSALTNRNRRSME